MLNLPKRPVTRFFIPLIDVLLLLFCIFLLMPKVDKSAVEAHEKIEDLQSKLRLLQSESGSLDTLRLELEERDRLLDLERKKAPDDRLVFRAVQIDENDGSLYYQERTPTGDLTRQALKSNDEVSEMIKRELRADQNRDKTLIYTIVRPQRISLFPTDAQSEEYTRWFQGRDRVRVRWAEDAGSMRGGGNP